MHHQNLPVGMMMILMHDLEDYFRCRLVLSFELHQGNTNIIFPLGAIVDCTILLSFLEATIHISCLGNYVMKLISI